MVGPEQFYERKSMERAYKLESRGLCFSPGAIIL